MVTSTPAKKILICEDEASLRELVRVVLGDEYGFLEAEDGREVLDVIERDRPDLVILDLMLPGKSGLDVLGELRRAGTGAPGVPVVVVTAWSHVREQAVAAGADGFLPKPFEPEELRSVVEGLLTER